MSALPALSVPLRKPFLFFWILLSCIFGARAQEPNSPPEQKSQTQPPETQVEKSDATTKTTRLKLKTPVERELKGGETDTYEIKLKKGQFLHVVAEQKGIDVVLSVIDPNGKVLVAADSPNGAWGPEPASVIAAISGIYDAQVKSLDKNAVPGKYSIMVSELRKPKPEDQDRMEAERELFEATKLVAQPGSDLQKVGKALEKTGALWHSVQEPYEEALCLEGIGDLRNAAAGAENYSQAIEYYNRALALFHDAGRARSETEVLGRMGAVSYVLGDKQKALSYFRQALPIHHAAGDRNGEAQTLNNMGVMYMDLGEKQKALDCYAQALPLYRTIEDRRGEAAVLNNLGRIYAELGEKMKGIDYFGQALPLLHAVGDRSGEATTLNNMGVVYADLGEEQKSLECHEQALPLYRAAGDRPGEAKSLNNIGQVYFNLGEKQKALDYYNQALPLLRAVGARSDEAITLNNIASVYAGFGETQKALQTYTQALALYRAAGDRDGEATNLCNIAKVYSERGEKQKALDYYAQALSLHQAVRDPAGEAKDLSNMGSTYSDLGEKQKALEYHYRALPLMRAIGDRSGEAYVLNNIAIVYEDLAEKDKALETYNQALALHRATGDRGGEAQELNNSGIVYADLGEPQKALECYEQALQLYRTMRDRGGEATVLNNIGLIYARRDENQMALEYYNKALLLNRAAENRDGEAKNLNNIGVAFEKLSEKQKALDYYGDALVVLRAEQNPLGEGTTLEVLMNYWGKNKGPSLAIFFGKQAVNEFQQIRRNIRGLDAGLQKSFLESKANVYRELGDLLISQGRLAEAQQVLDLLKEQEYFEFVRGNENLVEVKSQPVSLNPEEQASHEAYEKIAGEITALGVEFSELRAKRARTPEEEARFGELKDKLTLANQEMGRFFKTLYVEFGKNRQANQSAEAVREETGGMQTLVRELGPGTVAMYTLVGDTRYSVVVITGSTMQAREYPISAVDLRKKVATFLEALKNPASDPLLAAQELYKILLAPIAEDLKGAKAQTLMWSLNDVLRYVPMAALHDGKQYLVENYRNVVITPASIGRLKDKVDVSDSSIAGMGVSKDYDGLGPLPAVPGELRSVVRAGKSTDASGVLSGTLLLDDDFTETRMASALDKHYPVVHISSHFVLQAGNETNSYLLLGGKDVGGGKGYHLTLAELRDDPALTFDGTELLTLSACQTATSGTALNGREVDGLGITAQQKGAKAVLASLWSVADQSTALLMADFYKEWLGNSGMTKAAALQKVQLDMLHGTMANKASADRGTGVKRANDKDPASSFSHPFYWAPFILIGNWK